MTRTELDAIWERYMHRTDLAADLDEVYRWATQAILTRLMRSDTDTDKILEDFPSLYVHAGLIRLHQLAQDDDGAMRENQAFAISADYYAMKNSLTVNEPPVRMGNPYAT